MHGPKCYNWVTKGRTLNMINRRRCVTTNLDDGVKDLGKVLVGVLVPSVDATVLSYEILSPFGKMYDEIVGKYLDSDSFFSYQYQAKISDFSPERGFKNVKPKNLQLGLQNIFPFLVVKVNGAGDGLAQREPGGGGLMLVQLVPQLTTKTHQ